MNDLQGYLDGTHGRVIVDFYADWCGPCRRQGQLFHEIESSAIEAGALIVKVDVDQHKSLAGSLSVESLPTLMVYGDGKLLQRRTGLTDKKQLLSWIQSEPSKTKLSGVN